jgi:hypothetical protein
VGRQIQATGFYLSGLLSLVLAVLKVTLAVHWSWWRVLLPIWVFWGHQGLYVVVGLTWLSWIGSGEESEGLRIRGTDRLDGYQVVGMLCSLVLLDNLLRRIGGAGESEWWWLASGKMEVIFVSGILSLACQLRFWSGIVRQDSSGFRRR